MQCILHAAGVVVRLGVDARLVALATVAIVTVVTVTNSATVRAVATARRAVGLLLAYTQVHTHIHKINYPRRR